MTPEDMKALWASHCKYEFELRDVEGALSTMVDDPYLWNVPTMCGGRGQEGMRSYYRDNFVGTMPADAGISSVSLTVGGDQIAEEVILSFTHDREMPWLLPGVAPTGRDARRQDRPRAHLVGPGVRPGAGRPARSRSRSRLRCRHRRSPSRPPAVVSAPPPVAPRRPTVLRAHGDERVDDWFWLRDRDDPQVREYLEAENAYTRDVMARTEPLQQQLFEEIKSRVQETDASAPVRKGPYEYFSRTIEGRQYGIQC